MAENNITDTDHEFDGEIKEVVFNLSKNKLPKDDTMLEKLVSFLESQPQAFINIFKDADLKALLQQIGRNSSLEPSSLSAILRIIGTLCSSPDVIQNVAIRALLDHSSSTELHVDAGVAYAWTYVLTRIANIETVGVDFIVKQGYLPAIIKCLQHPSLFVRTTAKELMAQILIKRIPTTTTYLQQGDTGATSGVQKDEEKMDVISEYLADMLYTLQNAKPSNAGACKTFVDVIHELLLLGNMTNTTCLTWLNETIDLVNIAVGLMATSMCTFREKLLNCIALSYKLGLLSEKAFCAVKGLPHRYHSDGHRKLAITVAVWLLREVNQNEVDTEVFLLYQLRSLVENHSEGGVDNRLLIRCFNGIATFVFKRKEAIEFLCGLLSAENSFASILSMRIKLKHSCMDTLCCLLTPEVLEDEEIGGIVSTCLRGQLSNTGAPYQIVEKLLHILVKLLKAVFKPHLAKRYEGCCTLDTMRLHLQEKFMNVKWEIRDSALQFLTELATLSEGLPNLTEWHRHTDFVLYIWQGISDAESYVRATAISALSCWLKFVNTEQVVWSVLDKTEVFYKLADIVQNDSEAFARRAVVDLYSVLYFTPSSSIHKSDANESKSTIAENIINTLCDTIHDFDYEVKGRVLQFWQQFIAHLFSQTSNAESSSEQVPDYSAALKPVKRAMSEGQSDNQHNTKTVAIERLLEVKFQRVLISALDDHDKVVMSKACVLFNTLKENCGFEGQNCVKKSKLNTIPLHSFDWAQAADHVSKDEFLHFLKSLDIDTLICEANKSDDQYSNKPHSLFNDLLVAMALESEAKDKEHTEDQADLVDCY